MSLRFMFKSLAGEKQLLPFLLFIIEFDRDETPLIKLFITFMATFSSVHHSRSLSRCMTLYEYRNEREFKGELMFREEKSVYVDISELF